MNRLGSDQENILILEKRIKQQYAPIRDLKELRNSYTRVNQLPVELLSRIFTEVGFLNRQADDRDKLQWHRNIAHICRHWRNIALDMSALWNLITPQYEVNKDVLKYYISRVGRNQHVELVSSSADWDPILSSFEGSKSRIKSLLVTGVDSIRDFLQVATRYQSLASVVSLVIKLGQYCSTLPADMPFFAHSNQPALQALCMGECTLIPWMSLKPRFTALHTLVADVPLTCEDDCTAFVDALQHMSSLQKLHITQIRCKKPRHRSLKELCQTMTPPTSRPSPCDIILTGYGDIVLRILLMSLSLSNVQCIRIKGKHMNLSCAGLPPLYQILKDSAPRGFLESVQCISLESPDISCFAIRGFRKKITSIDPETFDSRGLAFELAGERNSWGSQHVHDLPSVVQAAQVLGASATTLHLAEPGATMWSNGEWPGMMILRSFSDIHTLVIEDNNAGAYILPTLGFSCLHWSDWDREWHTIESKWTWSELKEKTLAIGEVAWCYYNPYSMGDCEEILAFEHTGGVSEYWEPGGYTFKARQSFEGDERNTLYKMVSSLVPNLKVLELPLYQLDASPDCEFLLTCIWFRNAVGLPIPRVVLPYQKGYMETRFTRLKKAAEGTTMLTMMGREYPEKYDDDNPVDGERALLYKEDYHTESEAKEDDKENGDNKEKFIGVALDAGEEKDDLTDWHSEGGAFWEEGVKHGQRSDMDTRDDVSSSDSAQDRTEEQVEENNDDDGDDDEASYFSEDDSGEDVLFSYFGLSPLLPRCSHEQAEL